MQRAIAEALTLSTVPHGGSCGVVGKDPNGRRTPFVWHNRQDLPHGAERRAEFAPILVRWIRGRREVPNQLTR